MFSLENFYYILYENLVKPVKAKGFYFYPFGTTDLKNLTDLEIIKYHQGFQAHRHVLFYDQEPIIKNTFDKLTVKSNFCYSQPTKVFKILANSERSPLIRQIHKETGFYNWYYFYHGFAALDWYRDYQYIPKLDFQIDKVFISMNRLVTKDRSYRLHLVSRMLERELNQYGYVSLNLNDNGQGTWQEELLYANSKLPEYTKPLIQEQIGKLTNNLVIDHENTWGSLSADCSARDLRTNQRALWHIVSETVFYYDKQHLTEKIFKPIVSHRPFILVGAHKNLEYLKSYGFKTFDNWIDESYDNEQDPGKRVEMVIAELTKLCSMSISDIKGMYRDMRPVLDYNFNHLYGDFKQIIVKELLDNFEGCIDQWNHARLDDKHIEKSLIDFKAVHKLLTK